MEYTKGEWKASELEHDFYGKEHYSIRAIHDNRIQRIADVWVEANAQLIASAPIMHGQLKTGTEVLTEVQDIVTEVAKTCPPEIAEQMVVAQSYLCGVVAGNEIALAKAEGKDV